MKKTTPLPVDLIIKASLLFIHFVGLRDGAQRTAVRYLFAVDREGKKHVMDRLEVDRMRHKLKYDYLTTSITRMEHLPSVYEDRLYKAFNRRISKRKIRRCLQDRRQLLNLHQMVA